MISSIVDSQDWEAVEVRSVYSSTCWLMESSNAISWSSAVLSKVVPTYSVSNRTNFTRLKLSLCNSPETRGRFRLWGSTTTLSLQIFPNTMNCILMKALNSTNWLS
jgi:hypothetical protein